MRADVRVLWMLLGLLLAAPALADAATITVRVHWQPSASNGISGYRIYSRLVGGSYGAPVDAGLPTPAGDGTLAASITDVDTSVGHVFAVTAYQTGNGESALSNEITLTTLPSACNVDGDCAAPDACHFAHCQTGACMVEPVVCPAAGPCTPGTCDPEVGCSVQALPDGSSCDAGDPCFDGTCSGGECTPPVITQGRGRGSHFLSVNKLVLKATGRARRMVGGASFAMTGTVDPTVSGGTIELRSGAGVVLYRATVPARAFRGNKSRTAFKLIPAIARTVAGGVTKFLVRSRGATADVLAVGATPDLELAASQRTLTWALRFGSECVRAPDLACTAPQPAMTSCN